MLNLCLREKMKKVFVIMTTAGITLVNAGCVSGCEKQNDDDFMQPGGYSTDVDSTTPKKEDDYADVKIYSTDKRNEKFDESSNIVKETTTTSIGEGVLATNPYTKSNVVVTIANDVKNHNTVTDVIYPTTKPVTKATTKVTLKTTKATTKATTTTTTTTVPVTEPTVVETEPPVVQQPSEGEYSIEDIGNSLGACLHFSSDLNNDVTGITDRMHSVDIGYGPTPLGKESRFAVYSLNSEFFNNNEVTKKIYRSCNQEDIINYKNFLYSFKYVLDIHNTDIDYAKYTIDNSVGNFLNSADEAYRDGSFDDFMTYYFVEDNVEQSIKNNLGAMAILYSYDKGKYLNYYDIDRFIDERLLNHIFEVVYGCSYNR